MKDDGEWHEVALSHFWANQTTNMYLDGELVGQLAAERVAPFLFTLSPTTPTVRRPRRSPMPDVLFCPRC